MIVYICDDSKGDRIRLLHHIQRFAQENCLDFDVESFENGESMLEKYKDAKEKPKILFLDIFMHGKDGIFIAQKLIELGCKNGIVFTTSSADYALDAFKLNADGYLHKPYTHEDFLVAMGRFDPLFSQQMKSITIYFNRAQKKLYLSEIIYVESFNHCTFFHTAEGVFKTARPLKDFSDELLENSCFFRCGQSFLINSTKIQSYNDEIIQLENGEFVRIPVRIRKEIKKTLTELLD